VSNPFTVGLSKQTQIYSSPFSLVLISEKTTIKGFDTIIFELPSYGVVKKMGNIRKKKSRNSSKL
jgi:hypothetical protein